MVTVVMLEYNLIIKTPRFKKCEICYHGGTVSLGCNSNFEVSLAMSRFIRLSDCADMLKNRLIRILVRSV